MIANAAHLPAWKDLGDEVEVVGVSDIRKEAAEDTAKRFGVPRAYTDPQKMLDEVQPDIVSVCTPNVYHKQWTIASLKVGAHVFCEKPLAVSHADAVDMYATAERLGKMLYIAQTTRFFNEYIAAKDLVSTGALGEIYYAEINAIRRRGIPKWGYFHMKKDNAGGPVYDLGVHTIDSLIWLTGNPKVKSVNGMTYLKLGNKDEGLFTSVSESGAPIGAFVPRPYNYREFDVEDFATGYIRFHNDMTVLFKTSWAVNMSEDFSVRIVGTNASIQLPPLKMLNNFSRYQVDVVPRVPKDRDVIFFGHYGATVNMLKALRGEVEVVVKKEEVLNVIRTIEALYKSAEVGHEIVFD